MAENITEAGEREAHVRRYVDDLARSLANLSPAQVAGVIAYLEEAYEGGRSVFIMGNGGSAATASHMACDLGKNILPPPPNEGGETRRFQVISLTDNVPWITALANDLGYDYIFAEQLKNLARPGDLVIAITGSGNSPNILEGLAAARQLGARTVALLGFDGGRAKSLVDHYVLVQSRDYGPVEDMHLILDHILTTYFQNWVRARALLPLQASERATGMSVSPALSGPLAASPTG